MVLVQVLGHVSQRITDLYQPGYVHRDLKPANSMWQPRTYTWVLIDFGLVSHIRESLRQWAARQVLWRLRLRWRIYRAPNG